MQLVEAYQTSDGKLFTNFAKAKAAQDDLIGAEFDELVRVMGLDVGHRQMFAAATALLNDKAKRAKLVATMQALAAHLTHGDVTTEGN